MWKTMEGACGHWGQSGHRQCFLSRTAIEPPSQRHNSWLTQSGGPGHFSTQRSIILDELTHHILTPTCAFCTPERLWQNLSHILYPTLCCRPKSQDTTAESPSPVSTEGPQHFPTQMTLAKLDIFTFMSWQVTECFKTHFWLISY